jgi:WD40 repeat protein/serine/threonine protein kinase
MPATTRSEESIFAEVLNKRSPEERAAFLDGACGSDAALRARVENLLRSHEQAGSFLSPPLSATVDVPASERPGTVIGPYKLLQQIGEGGMGVVYMADQEQPVRRRVALRIIKPGMDSAQVIARFEAERQALALMEHQNIARVLDAGTTDSGRPYFVMELVKGVPLTKFCDENRLTPRERLELFVPVCQAIQHAHQKGVIHRDIKPSNVMVTLYDGKPVPKVIDFGVAKATSQKLTARTMFTAYGQIVGTFEYMSPEQAEMSGLDIDTRSDIYSLGVLLYELLTGTTPLSRKRLREAALTELLRAIKEEEPPKPSTRLSQSGQALASISAQRKTEPSKLARLMRGELDWIVMKALDKDRSRRYETANGLARDVEHYLHDEPVEACPPSARYRLHKFLRKHRAGALTAATFVALLLSGIAVSTWQAVRATRAETEALAAADMEKRAKEHAQAAEQGEAAQRKNAEEQTNLAIKQADRSRRLLYASDMNLAGHAWEDGDTGRALSLLERQRPQPGQDDLRGFEWRYLWRLCQDASRQTLPGHTGDNIVRSVAVAFSPDRRALATSGLDSCVRIWDLASQRHIRLLGLGSVSLAFAPDGKTLAIAGGWVRRDVCLWDVAARCERPSFWHRSAVVDVAFSPDGKRLATACADRTVRIWEVAARREVATLAGHPGEVFCVKFSPDGKTLASCGRGTAVRLWDVDASRLITTLEGGHTTSVTFLAFSPDSKTLASGGFDGHVRLWDTANRQVMKTLRVPRASLTSAAFSPDGKMLATGGGDGTLRVWDLTTNQVASLLRGHRGRITAVAFAPDGRSLVSGSPDRTVKVWDVASGPGPIVLTNQSSIDGLAISPGGKIVAVGDYFDNSVKLYDVASRQRPAILKGHEKPVWTVAIAPNGQYLASTSTDGLILLWDLATKKRVAKFQHDSGVPSASFSSDGKLLAAGSSGGVVLVWEIATRKQVATLKGTKVQFSPDGTLLAARSGDTVRVWEARTWLDVAALKTGENDSDGALAFAPAGRILATGSNDGTLRLWDVARERQIASSRGHAQIIYSVAFSPDGRRLATGASDSTVKLWDVALLQEVATFTGHHGPVVGVEFSADGDTLATAGWDATVRLWQAPPLPTAPRKPDESLSEPPVETIRRFYLDQFGTAQASLASEGKVHRVEVTAIDGTNWHARLSQVFEDFQEGATYTVRFRAKADAARPIPLYGQIGEPDWHDIGLNQIVPLTTDWKTYQCDFQAKNLAAWNSIQFMLGDRTGSVWIADFTVTKESPAEKPPRAKGP